VNSKLYKWNGASFVEFQSIPTSWAIDWEFFKVGTDSYLAVANFQNDSTHSIHSTIYKWSGVNFVELQSIPSDGAYNWESFIIGDRTYLALANSRTDSSNNIDSKLYKMVNPLPVCTPQARESDIMLVVDRSGSMGDSNKLNDAKIAITTFLSSTHAPPDRVGLVSFESTATLDQPLTTNKAAVNSAAQALTASGGTRLDYALLQARLELTSTRHIITHTQVIILLTDGGQNPPGNDPVLAEANAAKAQGAIIFTIGLGPDVDAALLQQVATSPGHYYFAPTGAQLEDIYRLISTAITCPDIGGQVFIDRDANGLYAPGADDPLPNAVVRLAGPSPRQATSQSDGTYVFPDNFAGTYTITLDLASLPGGYQPTTPITQVVVLSSSDDLDNNFGLRPLTRPNAIVFTRPRPGTGMNGDIWIMNADGTSQTQLTTYAGEDRWPTLSPDGSRIAYVSFRDNHYTLWVMNSDGTNPRQLPVSGDTQAPQWSPDGTRIAFGNNSVDWWEIWVINADGSNLRLLTTHWPAAGLPSWSPDGLKIVYAIEPSVARFDLYTVNSDGTNQALLLSSGSGFSNHVAAWSPDGTQIATLHWPAGGSGPGSLWLMSADGSSGQALVSNIDSSVQNISWTSDGNWLVFGKDNHIWRVARNGTDLTQITSSTGWEPSTNASGYGPLRPNIHIFLPILARNYCTGPIVDNFSNPASG
jgi:uncharacterized protein YegL